MSDKSHFTALVALGVNVQKDLGVMNSHRHEQLCLNTSSHVSKYKVQTLPDQEGADNSYA